MRCTLHGYIFCVDRGMEIYIRERSRDLISDADGESMGRSTNGTICWTGRLRCNDVLLYCTYTFRSNESVYTPGCFFFLLIAHNRLFSASKCPGAWKKKCAVRKSRVHRVIATRILLCTPQYLTHALRIFVCLSKRSA